MPIEVVAAMTEVIAECQAQTELPHGVNMLIDPPASIAVAHATGGRFVRAFLTGALVGDIGMMTPDGARALRLRANLGAENIRIICNVTPGFSINLDTRSVEQQASGAVFIGLADVVCVGGPAAGKEADISVIERVAKQVPGYARRGRHRRGGGEHRAPRRGGRDLHRRHLDQIRPPDAQPVEPRRAQALVRAYENRRAA